MFESTQRPWQARQRGPRFYAPASFVKGSLPVPAARMRPSRSQATPRNLPFRFCGRFDVTFDGFYGGFLGRFLRQCLHGVRAKRFNFFREVRDYIPEAGPFGSRTVRLFESFAADAGCFQCFFRELHIPLGDQHPGVVIAVSFVSTDNNDPVRAFCERPHHHIGRYASRTLDADGTNARRILPANRACHVSCSVSSFPAQERGNLRRKRFAACRHSHQFSDVFVFDYEFDCT